MKTRAKNSGRRAARKPGQTGDRVARLEAELQHLREELAAERQAIEATVETQRELETSRQRYAHLYDQSPLGYLTLDGHGIILELNLTAARMLEQPREAVAGRPLLMFVAKGDRRAWLRHLARAPRREPETVTELALAGDPATPRIFELRTVPQQPDMAGPKRARRYLATLADITARKQAEEALRQSEAGQRAAQAVEAEWKRFRQALDRLPAYLVLLAPDYQVTFANRFFEERFGKSRGKRCFEYLFNRTEPCENCQSYQVLKTGRRHHWEWAGPDGRDYDIHDFPFVDADGSPLIMEVGLDITETKRAQAEVNQINASLEQRVTERTAALQASEERFRLLVEQAVDGIFVSDTQGNYRDVNSAGAAMLGYTPEEICRLNIADVVAPEEAARLPGEVARFADGAVARSEWRFRRKDGSFFDGEVMGRQLPDGRLQAIVRDITQRKQAQAALQRLSDRQALLSRTVSALLVAPDPQAVVESLCNDVRAFLACGVFFNYLLDPGASRLRFNACGGVSPNLARKVETLELGASICGSVARDGQRIVAEHLADSSDPRTALVKALGVRAYACHPLLGPNHEVLGTLSFGAKNRDTFAEEDLALMKVVADHVAIAMARKRAETELQQVNRTLTALGKSSQALMRAADEAAYLEEVCRIVVEDCGHAMVWIGFAENDEAKTVRPVASAGLEEGYLDTLRVSWADTERGRGPTGTAIRTGQPCGCGNMLTDPHFGPWRAEALRRGYASSLALPLKANGQTLGALTIYARQPEKFSQSEVNLLRELADDLAHGISSLRLRAAHAQTEAALRASEQRYRSLVDLSPDAIIVVQDGRFVFANPAALRMHGAGTAGELLGRPVRDIVHPDDWDVVRDRLERALRGETMRLDEVRGRRPDGQPILVESVGIPVVYDGRSAVQVILRDISERRRAEEQLHLLSAAVESAGNGIAITDRRGVVLWVNPAFAALTGYSPADAVGQTPRVLKSGRQSAEFYQNLWGTILAGKVWRGELVNRRKDGSLYPEEMTLTPVRASGGAITHFIAIKQDISERKQTEALLRHARDELEARVNERTAELRQSNESLRREIAVRRQTEADLSAAEQRYRTVADFTHDWEYWESPDARLNYCSPACIRTTGYSAQEFMADPQLLQRIVHPDDAGLWREHREALQAASEPREIEFRICRQDGGVRWISHVWQPVRGADVRFLGIRASNRDITDRKEQEAQARQLREELAHVTRASTVGELAASLAHELNQPLTAILSNAQTAQVLLAADPPDVAEVREALGDIEGDSQRAGAVIQRLRALFGRTGQKRGPLQINVVLQETLDLLRSEFVVKRITTQVRLEPELPPVLCNRIELQQVALNLIVNAMDAMGESEPGQRRLEIATRRGEDETVRISFRDSGTGIKVEPISRLFEPFFTTKPNGMGMGLAISQSIMEAYNGSLRAANNPDRGATFELSLPVHHPNDQ